MMNRMVSLMGILIAAASVAFPQERPIPQDFPPSPPIAQTERERKILAVMDHMMKANETYLSVPPQDGEALQLLAEAVNAKGIVEIGTSTGYSGLWFCLALQKTGGHLTTFEIDHGRASMAHEHFQNAGVANLVTVVEGDAHANVVKLKGPVDLAFIDAEKPGYVDYLHKVLALVRPGGLILAHNVDLVPEYLKVVTANPDLETIFYMQGRGLAITLRKR
jgi:caffeoyl-CoA O-methyltransferase